MFKQFQDMMPARDRNAAKLEMGAWIADVLLLTLGYLAFLFPLIVAVKVYQMFRRRHQPMIWNGWLFSWRLIGFVLTLLAGTALAALHGTPGAHFPEGAGAGGILGELLSGLSRPVLNLQGSTLLFLTLFLSLPPCRSSQGTTGSEKQKTKYRPLPNVD